MAITFTRTAHTTDPVTGLSTTSSSTITGSAIQVRGDAQRYDALGLKLDTMPTLFFSPTTYGNEPLPGDTVTWPASNGDVYTVRDVAPIAPDGVLIAARIVIGR